MSQTGTPTEFLQLGITEPDDTLNVLVDLNGQWRKIDTGVKNVDTKANTNASGISALNTAVQDNTENITNILETNVNQQTSIDTLQSKVATLEEDDTSYGSRITAVEAGVQENSELINDLEVDLSGVKTSVGTVPSGSNLQGEVDGLDTRVTALENSGSVAAVEARVTTLENNVGTVPAGETVQGQITTLNGQVNSGNIPFRFSVDGGGNYGYLKADDSFVPFSSGSPTSIGGHEVIQLEGPVSDNVVRQSCFMPYYTSDTSSPYHNKILYIPTMELIDRSDIPINYINDYLGELLHATSTDTYGYYDRNTHSVIALPPCFAVCSIPDSITYYTKDTNQYTMHYIDLIDSTYNLTLQIPMSQNYPQSNTIGKKGMIFEPYNRNATNNTLFYYFTDNTSVSVNYSNNNIDYTTGVSVIPFAIGKYYSGGSDAFKITTSGINQIDPDGIYCQNNYKYIKFGNYLVSIPITI